MLPFLFPTLFAFSFFLSFPPPLITMAGVCTQCWIDVTKGHNLSLILTLRKKCSFTVSPESTLLMTDFYIYLFLRLRNFLLFLVCWKLLTCWSALALVYDGFYMECFIKAFITMFMRNIELQFSFGLVKFCWLFYHFELYIFIFLVWYQFTQFWYESG